MSTATLILGILFSAIGCGYLVYGRKQRRAVPFVVGVFLLVLPAVVSNAWAEAGVGAILVALPYFIRL